MQSPRWPLVYIEWVDSDRGTEWEYLTKWTDAHRSCCRSVGWLVKRDLEYLTVLPHRSGETLEDTQGFGEIDIPRCAVLRMCGVHIDEGEESDGQTD